MIRTTNDHQVTITTGEFEMLLECKAVLDMIQLAMRNYMEIWRVDSEPTLDSKFMVVLKAAFPYAYEETLAKLRNKKQEEGGEA